LSRSRARLLRPPTLRTEDTGRSSSWLELFFDLVFVIAITQLGVALAADLSLRGYGRFLLLFVPIWWSWVGYTNYADRFDSDDIAFRGLVLAAMLAIAVVAVAIPETFRHRSMVFAGGYVAVRVLLVVLYARARAHVSAARPLCDVTLTVFLIGVGLWLASLALTEPLRFALWGMALVLEGATPWVARRAMTSVPYHASHLPERYGLWTLIVLGESLVAVAVGLGHARWGALPIAAGALGFLTAASLWWLYFDSIERIAIRRSLLARNAFIYGHLLIALGLAISGVGVKTAILHADAGNLDAAQRWALCGGPALFLLAHALVLEAATDKTSREAVAIRLIACALIVTACLVATPVGAAGLLALVAAVLAATTVAEIARSGTARRVCAQADNTMEPRMGC